MGIYGEDIFNALDDQLLGRISLVFMFGVEFVKCIWEIVFGYRRCKLQFLQEIYL